MKKNIFLTCFSLAILMFNYGCSGDNEKEIEENISPSYAIEVTIDSLNYKTAYLSDYKDGEFINTDSSDINNGKFSFKGSVDIPVVKYIVFNESDTRIPVFVENSIISISGDFSMIDSLKITGSSIHDKLLSFKEEKAKFTDRLSEIAEKYYAAEKEGDTKTVEEMDKKYSEEDSLQQVFIENYISKNLNSAIAPYLSLRYMLNKEVEELEKLKNSFAEEIQKSEYVTLISDRIAIMKNTAIGQPAPLFSLNNVNGESISLESFKGKYVLIDFWASWCGPCRQENPNVVAAYKKYHEKGFEIFGVSFDTDKEKWEKAIEKDGLIWTHVSDLEGWGNAAGKIYGIRSIPHSILLDKEGIIIAKNLRGEELHNKLKEIFETEI